MDLLRLTIVASEWNRGSETTAVSRMARARAETRIAFPSVALISQVPAPCHGHMHRGRAARCSNKGVCQPQIQGRSAEGVRCMHQLCGNCTKREFGVGSTARSTVLWSSGSVFSQDNPNGSDSISLSHAVPAALQTIGQPHDH